MKITDGYLTIKTRADVSTLTKDLSKVKKELDKLKKEEAKLNNQKVKIEVDVQKYKEELAQIKAATDKELQNAFTTEQVDFVLGTETAEIDALNNKYAETFSKQKEIESAINDNISAQSSLNQKVDELNDKINQSKGFEGIKDHLKDLNKSITNSIKKVAKWALAVFGLRTAYNAVRSAASTLAGYNEQISSDLQYIQFAMASALQPVVEKIISLAYTLMSYINLIAKAWFNVDLFAKASSKSMSKASKSAKEMNKSLSSFDEINQLQDTSSSDTGGGTVAPSVDLSSMENVQIPTWLQWIMDNKDIILGFVYALAIGLASLKLASIVSNLQGITEGINGLLALGIGIMLTGLILLIQSIVDFIKDPSWENFANILLSLSVILAGLAVAMLAVNAANPVVWIIAAIAAVAALAGAVIKYWDQIKSVLSTVGSWINNNIIKPVANFFVGLWNGIVNGVTTAVNGVKKAFNAVVTFFKNIISTIVSLFKTIGTKVGDVIGSAFKAVINGILSAIENILNFPIKSVNKLLDVINAVPGINISKLSTFSLPRLATGGIVDVPKTGVNIGGAIAGEDGPEGVLPLTNANTMSRLGYEIGKWITLNIDLTSTIDGRILNKRLETIKANNSFARNGGS